MKENNLIKYNPARLVNFVPFHMFNIDTIQTFNYVHVLGTELVDERMCFRAEGHVVPPRQV